MLKNKIGNTLKSKMPLFLDGVGYSINNYSIISSIHSIKKTKVILTDTFCM